MARILALCVFLLVQTPLQRASAYEMELVAHHSSVPVITVRVNGSELLSLKMTEENARLALEMLEMLSLSVRERDAVPLFLVQGKELKMSIRGGASFAVALSELAEPSGADGSLAKTLASRWERAVSIGWLGGSLPELTIPAGESRSLRLALYEGDDVSLMNPFPMLVDGIVDGSRVSVFGLREGEGYLFLRAGEQTVRLPFTVGFLAAYLPESVTLRLSGSGYQEPELARLGRIQLLAMSSLAPGAEVAVRLVGDDATPGSSMAADVSASAPGRIGVHRRIPLKTELATMMLPPPKEVILSNEPEQITAPGRLLAASLLDGDRVRLVYHHQNRSGAPKRVRVRLSNLSSSSQRVFFRGGTGAPDESTLYVGLASVRDYFRQLDAEQGCLLTLAAGADAVLWEGTLRDWESCSGNMDLIMLSEGPVAVIVEALPDGAETEGSASSARAPRPSPRFAPAAVSRQYRYDLDGHWLFIRLGSGEMRDVDTSEPLVGDYGLLQEFEVILVNGESGTRRARLSFDATGGEARGVFVVDGKLIQTPPVYPGSPLTIARFEVSGNASRRVRILTMPLSGSHYPASLVFSDVD